MVENKLDLIFKAYDVRGVYGDTLTEQTAYNIGIAFSKFVKADQIIIGHDGRTSNLTIFNAVASGIESNGKQVYYIGTVPTDVVYSLSGLLNLPGLIITASHNPKEWNGFKFCNSGASPIGIESGLLQIKELASESQEINLSTTQHENENVIPTYMNHLKTIVNPDDITSSMKFGIDGGNGAIGSVIESLTSTYNLNYDGIYMDVDGNFPNHPADPSNPDNLIELVELVLTNKYQFGVAFDGDADRAVFSDDKGNIISGSIMTAIISDWLLEKRGEIKNQTYLTTQRVELMFDMPLAEIVFDFYDRLKTVSKGYASFDYSPIGMRKSKLVKVDLLLNGSSVDALSSLIHADNAYSIGKKMCEKLRQLIPRQQFDIPIQAAIGAKIISRETIKAVRKDVTAKCYGGDISRKRKLLERQKKGKKKMRQIGSVEIPQEAFLAVLKLND